MDGLIQTGHMNTHTRAFLLLRQFAGLVGQAQVNGRNNRGGNRLLEEEGAAVDKQVRPPFGCCAVTKVGPDGPLYLYTHLIVRGPRGPGAGERPQ